MRKNTQTGSPQNNWTLRLDSKLDPTYWDKSARSYAKRAITNPSVYEAWLARVRLYLNPTNRALEIGCGTGTTI